MPVTEQAVLDVLRQVQDPDLHRDIVTLGFIKDLTVSPQGEVAFKIQLTTPACPVKDLLEAQARELVTNLPGVTKVDLEMTAQVRERQTQPEDLLVGVKQVIAVASGKGGVGKSTLTVNLAVALAQQGAKVGIMDADVYGPSIPLMLGAHGEAPLTKDQKIVPIVKFGVKVMSLGMLLTEGQVPLWRGPMVAGTVKQLLTDVAWGELDYLFVDLPPGTGDAPMTLAQSVPLTGVVIVTTPHNVAANIAGGASQLFKRLNTTVLGVIENMGGLVCPKCGEVTRIFAGLSGQNLAEKLRVPYLGSIPLDPLVSQAADEGKPSLIAYQNGPQAEAFRAVAGAVAAQASIISMSKEQSAPNPFVPSPQGSANP